MTSFGLFRLKKIKLQICVICLFYNSNVFLFDLMKAEMMDHRAKDLGALAPLIDISIFLVMS